MESTQRSPELPVIPLRGLAVMPGEIMHCDIGRVKSLSAMEAAINADGTALFVAQKNPALVEIAEDDLYKLGTVCRIRQVFRIQGDTVHLLVTGVSRGELLSLSSDDPYFRAEVRYIDEASPDAVTEEALRRRLTEAFTQFAQKQGRLTQEQQAAILAMPEFPRFVDAIGQCAAAKLADKQALIEQSDPEQRALDVLNLIGGELQIMEINERIAEKVRAALERNQKDFILREQMKALREEIGGGDDEEIAAYRRRMEEKSMPESVRAALNKQIDRYAALPGGSHEAPMAQAYIELVLDLPWTEETQDNLDLMHARETLDRDHYGMGRVKTRIVESLAVQKLTGNPQGQILCLVGPPGVGKTSIARAIAEAMGRKFVRMSLGGVHDEAEIRGHRRTYIGAQPGRVIEAMRKAGSINPVLLFDEIDKLGQDIHGDPSSAMLEVLDSAQNNAFSDHFLELPYDLSHCMLLTTANDAASIPRPLLDRMELIEVPGYLFDEKVEIARRHLLPKQMEKHGLKRANLRVSDAMLGALIEEYTREAGVREMERVLGAVCRKAACEVVEGKTRITLTQARVEYWLGPRKYYRDSERHADLVGVSTGLAWTPVGGETLEIEAIAMPGKGNLQLTGQLGDVMQESAKAAMTYVRANAAKFDIAPTLLETLDIHIHVPEGAVPKDGPSAGVALLTALVSALTGIPVRGDVAMTGEITLRGRVLPIGGLREKLLAAVRIGIDTVVLPEANRASLAEVPDTVKAALHIVYADEVGRVLDTALAALPEKVAPILPVAAQEGAHAAIRH